MKQRNELYDLAKVLPAEDFRKTSAILWHLLCG